MSKYSEYLGFRKAILHKYHILYNTVRRFCSSNPQIKLIHNSEAKISIVTNKCDKKVIKQKNGPHHSGLNSKRVRNYLLVFTDFQNSQL